MRRLSINQGLILTVIGALLPMGVFSIAQGVANRNYAQQLIGERLARTALGTASAQREPIAITKTLLQILAQDNDVRNIGPHCTENLVRIIRVQAPIENFVRADAQGKIVCSVAAPSTSANLANYPWWHRGLDHGRFSIQGPIISKSTGKPVVIAMLPLFDAQGKSLGSVNARISLDWLEGSLARNKYSGRAIVGIVGAHGQTLVSVGPEKLPVVNLAASAGKVASVGSSSGAEWLYSSFPLFEDQLHVVYAEPKTSLLSAPRGQLRMALALPMLGILLTILAVWIGVNRLAVRWLRELARLAQQYAVGNYNAPGPRLDTAPVEIEALATDMKGMAVAIVERNESLEAAAATARMLAREVNHRVKNNLQMVMSLLSLQTDQVTDAQSREALEQTRIRMSTFALIHRLLYDQQDDSERGLVNMDHLFSQLCSQLRASNHFRKSVVLESTSDVGDDLVDNAIPVALFVVEAVVNAYRHAFPDGRAGTISVNFVRDRGRNILTIEDSGIGYDYAVTQPAMGNQLMIAFAEQLCGTLNVVRTSTGGVSITLSYPVSE